MTPCDTFPQAGGGTEADVRLLTDFTPATPDLGWYVVNDNVMGGRSEGGFDVQGGTLRFAGRTNTRGGGFSSIRSATPSLDLSAYDGIRLRVRGDGRRYTWQLRTDARVYGRDLAYWADFETDAGGWQDVDVPFANFVPRFRGARLDGPALDTGTITGMGLMIYDKRDGAFELQLDRVQAYADTAPFSLARLRWAYRVLVPVLSEEDMLEDAFRAIARDGAGIVEVQIRLQKTLCAIAALSHDALAEAARRLSRAALERAARAIDHEPDIERVTAAAGWSD